MEGRIKTVVSIDRIVYSKNDWHILSLWDINNNTKITAKGTVINLQENMNYTLIGNLVEDKKYGEQYNIVLLTPYINENNKESCISFLKEILTEGQIKEFYNIFENPLEIIKNKDVDALCKVKGIGNSYAHALIKRYEQNEKYIECVEELSSYEIPFSLIKKIMDKYNNIQKCIDIITKDTYRLINDIPMIGWNISDKIALKIGIGEYSIQRIGGYILHILTESGDRGHTWLSLNQIVSKVFKLYEKQILNENKKEEIIFKTREAVNDLIDNSLLYRSEDREKISLLRLYQLELNISNELVRLMGFNQNIKVEVGEVEKRIKTTEIEQNFPFSEEQKEAIYKSTRNSVMILTARSGSGKSTTAKGIVEVSDEPFKLLALSGMAASRLGELVGAKGETIHRFLGAGMGDKGGFKYNKENRIKENIILDECGMISGDIFYSLLSSLEVGSKLIILGDTWQISAIGNCNVLKDIIDSKYIPCIELTKIFRQAQKSAIITESHKVGSGKKIFENEYVGVEVKGELKDLLIDSYKDSSMTSIKMLNYYIKIYNQIKDVKKIQALLCLKDRGKSSCLYVNKLIQTWLLKNGKIDVRFVEVQRGNIKYNLHVGDKVLNTTNNYHVFTIKEKEDEIFNGYQGIVKELVYNKGNKKELKGVVIDFDLCDEDIYLKKELLNTIELAYCITNSKYQGNQNDFIITGFDYSAYMLLNREMVYTSMTRAKKKCIICCENKAIEYAIAHSDTKIRQTYLSNMLKGR